MKVKTPAWMASIIEAAQTAHFYIIAQPGPLVFVLREHDSDNTVKVSLGSPHTCSCDNGSKANYCIHISFLLQRKYQLPSDHPWIAQTSLTNTDIESLLQLRHLAARKVTRPMQSTTATIEGQQTQQNTTASRPTRSRNPITELDACPICLDGFIESDEEEINYSALPFCSNCGNSLHSRCIQLFHQHARQTKAKEVCPYCRSLYEDGRKYSLPTASNPEKVTKTFKVCSRCEAKLESTSIKRVFGSEQYCSACFVTLTSGMYKKKGRRISLQTKHEDPNVARERALALYRRFAFIQYREITSEDYNLLLELENPYMMDISRKPQRFPSYLIWSCFKQTEYKNSIFESENRVCFLCGHHSPTFSGLLVEKGGQASDNTVPDDVGIAPKLSICLNVDSIATILLEQGEQLVSGAALQELQDKNIYLDIPCTHTVHKLCAVLGSLICKPEVVFIVPDEQESSDISNYKLRVFPDYCTACKTPYIGEWVRGSKLAPKQPQLPPIKSSSEKRSTRKASLEDQVLGVIIDKDALSVTGLPLSSCPTCTEASRPKSQLKTLELARSKSLATKPVKKNIHNHALTSISNERSSLPVCKSSPCDLLTAGMVVKPVT